MRYLTSVVDTVVEGAEHGSLYVLVPFELGARGIHGAGIVASPVGLGHADDGHGDVEAHYHELEYGDEAEGGEGEAA